MKSSAKHILTFSVILGIVLIYLPILNSYFQQDEWHNFGIHIYGLNTLGLKEYLGYLFTTGIPVSFLFTFFNYLLFGIQNTVPAIGVLVLVIANSYLWIHNIEEVSKSYFVAVGSLLFGYLSYLSVQAVTWVIPAISTQGVFLFINISILFLLKYLRERKIYLVLFSIFFSAMAALTRTNGFFMFLALPLFQFLLDKVKMKRRMINSIKLLFVMFFIAVAILTTRASNSKVGATRFITSETQIAINSIFLPLKSIAHYVFVDPQNVYAISTAFYIRYYQLAPDPLTIQTIMTEYVSIVTGLSMISLFLLLFPLSKKTPLGFWFGVLFYSLSFSPYVLDSFSTGRGFLESRYYYLGAFGLGVIFFTYFELVLKKIKKNKHFSSYLKLLLTAIFFIFSSGILLYNLVLIRSEIKLRNELTNKRLEILSYFSESLDKQIDQNFILYIQDVNVENQAVVNVTGRYFQTGFLYPFLVYNYEKNSIPYQVFSDDYYWDSDFQGVRETNEYQIGLFYDFEKLKEYILENSIDNRDIIGLEFDYSLVKNAPEKRGDLHDLRYVTYKDVSDEVRMRLNSE